MDIYSGADLRLTVFRRNLRFAAIDVDRLLCDDPALARSLCEACLALLEAGDVPPLPVTTYPAHRYEDALRLMMAGRHQGKLALELPSEGLPGDARPVDLRPLLDPEASYLVTGGLGGLGLCVVSYLAAAGARHLVLMDRDPGRGRSGQWVHDASPLMESPLRDEVEIELVTGDVADAGDVRRCIEGMGPSLKGVFHLAGILEDALLDEVTGESIDRVFAPKALGAWHLHEATRDLDLDHFVLLSSAASVFGSVGQTAYTAANAYLDALAAYRRRRGLPALAFNSAGIAEAGMASRDTRLLGLMRANGLPPLATRVAIASLDYALRRMRDHDHIIAARIEDPPWTPDGADYPRTGMYLTNRAAFASEEAGELTVPGVAEADPREGGRAVRPRRGRARRAALELRAELDLRHRAWRVHSHPFPPPGERGRADDDRVMPVARRGDHGGRRGRGGQRRRGRQGGRDLRCVRHRRGRARTLRPGSRGVRLRAPLGEPLPGRRGAAQWLNEGARRTGPRAMRRPCRSCAGATSRP